MVSIDDLLDQVWSGVVVTPDSVYQAVAALRRLLGDDAKQPAYIATVPRLGYRMVAAVRAWDDQPGSADGRFACRAGTRQAVSIRCAAAPEAPHFASSPRPPSCSRARAGNDSHAAAMAATPQKSVAVLPFLDLTTQEMNEEYFADGMTEELISKLSAMPGLRVPPPTSSFYFKGKQVTVADVARSLGVTYVLDGSVRKSDDTLRIAARLIRADDGYVIWSETYDRPSEDRLKVQEDIASEVAKALRASIS